jgi:phosphomannomutase
MPHKFKTGQLVEYHPPRGLYAPRGHHLITAQLPERNGEFEYRIRHTDEMHERIANERELSIAQEAPTTAEIIEYMGYRLDPRPVGRGWRVFIYPPGNKPVLSEYASSLEKGSKDQVIKEAEKIVDTDLERRLRIP